MPILEAMTIAAAISLLVVGGLVYSLRRIERAAGIWRSRNQYGMPLVPPWYVRFYEFLNQR